MVRRVVAVLAAVAAIGVLAGCDPAPGSGLTLRSLEHVPLTGLEPGDVVRVRVAGAQPNQTVYVYECTESALCLGGQTVQVDAKGAATVPFTVAGWIYDDCCSPFTGRTQPCRPTGCGIYATTSQSVDGYSSEVDQPLALGFDGETVIAFARPTSGLHGGELVHVQGRVRGAKGRTVVLGEAQYDSHANEGGYGILDATRTRTTVRFDGTFDAYVRLRSATSSQPADCGDNDFLYCTVVAFVRDPACPSQDVPDSSFGYWATFLGFGS